MNERMKKSINQSINQLINQSINQPTNQSINQPINRSNNQSINQSINQPINKSITSYHQCWDLSFTQPIIFFTVWLWTFWKTKHRRSWIVYVTSYFFYSTFFEMFFFLLIKTKNSLMIKEDKSFSVRKSTSFKNHGHKYWDRIKLMIPDFGYSDFLLNHCL